MDATSTAAVAMWRLTREFVRRQFARGKPATHSSAPVTPKQARVAQPSNYCYLHCFPLYVLIFQCRAQKIMCLVFTLKTIRISSQYLLVSVPLAHPKGVLYAFRRHSLSYHPKNMFVWSTRGITYRSPKKVQQAENPTNETDPETLHNASTFGYKNIYKKKT